MKTGWFIDPGRQSTVWATGDEYTETGSAPGRVVVIAFMPHLGPFMTWAYDAHLDPAKDRGIAAFVDACKSYYERQRAGLREQIANCDRAERRWVSRCSGQTVSAKHE